MMLSHLRVLAISCAALVAVSCDATRNPLTPGPVTNINFYSASAALTAWPEPPNSYAPREFIYLDNGDTSSTDYPYLDYGSYPLNGGGGQLSYTYVPYMHLTAGPHRFRFSNPEHGIIADTTLTLGASHNTVLYLVDSLQQNIHALPVDETAPGVSGAVRIRVLQLSPDAGIVGVYVISDTGATVWSNLPQSMPYGAVTPYITLDSSVVSGDGNVYLSFYSGADTSNVIATAIVPFLVGRSFHVVLQGLLNSHQFSYPDPSTPGQTVSPIVGPSLTTAVRATD